MAVQPFPWKPIIFLSITVMVSFGVILYGFSVYLTRGAAGGEFSTGLLSVAYGGSVLTGGLLAFPVGRFADRRGVRAILGVGSLAGSAGLAVFSIADRPWEVLAAWWLLIGPASAMTFYEPAYVAIDRWCHDADRPRATAILTLVGGLAGLVFIPGIEALVGRIGWRPTLRLLAGLLAVVGVGTAWWVLPPDTSTRQRAWPGRSSLTGLARDRRFVLYSVGMVLSLFAAQGVIAHRVARFEEAGFALGVVAAWAGLSSLASLPGRWLGPMATVRFSPTALQGTAVAILAVSVALLAVGSNRLHLVGHFLLFGLAFGAVLPLRALAMGNWYSGARYGRVMGAQWTLVALGSAAGPAAVGLARDRLGGYEWPVAGLAAVYLAASGLILWAGRSRAAPVGGEPDRRGGPTD